MFLSSENFTCFDQITPFIFCLPLSVKLNQESTISSKFQTTNQLHCSVVPSPELETILSFTRNGVTTTQNALCGLHSASTINSALSLKLHYLFSQRSS